MQYQRYTLSQALKHACRLKSIMHAADESTQHVLTVDPQALYDRGVQAVALDFDGVLAPHGMVSCEASICAWIDQLIACFGVERVFMIVLQLQRNVLLDAWNG